ncbi:WASH complex subunit 3 [Panulirus ornatus]|uniref:WASH complex subunit 3 n=1 Tax=Panulirus ornatus TaxID=150431 RepID=UPI003A87C85B
MEKSPVVTPNVDYSQVEAIDQKRTLAFINHWAQHTVAFLNQFSAVCEERLMSLDIKLRRADHTLAILEAKLSSVPGLEGVVAPTIESAPVATNVTEAVNTETIASQIPVSSTIPPSSTTEADASNTAPEEEGRDVVDETPAPEPTATPISQDPRFVQYFKMLKLGVPEPAVRMKMSSEGLDPSLLDDPNAPAPPTESKNTTGADGDSDSSSVSSWSD